MELEVIILAAGQGTRMKSDKPKVLHPLAGRPILEHVITTASQLNASNIHVVYGHGGDQVQTYFSEWPLSWQCQVEQLGTGHAVQQALPALGQDCLTLILYGDVPLITLSTLRQLLAQVDENHMALLTTVMEDATGYGRIIRDDQQLITKIVEQKDCDKSQLSIQEINTGIMALSAHYLHEWLSQLTNDNAQGEYYLTDVIEMAVHSGVTVNATVTDDPIEVSGINDKVQLQQMERAYQYRRAVELMQQGVTLVDANRFELRGQCEVGKDVSIDINAILTGRVVIGNNVKIGPNVWLEDVEIGDDVEIFANSVIQQAKIGRASRIGPFARIRPDTVLDENTHIGNFVEIKKSTIAKGSKVNHLSYIGDSEIGSQVNIGAGTITCNYDGANKFKTIIGDGAFIGSDTQLVAPVVIGKGATIGAGSTITKDTPAEQLTLSRSKQVSIENWQRPVKKK
jgi:bifunctional UDP-N-acetylglucosamine pyrophosphorylase/glucosamine-1-phosphate N-acetyltransferase